MQNSSHRGFIYGTADYIADNYGTCDRGSDCYWGTDAHGRSDGCLRIGWRGRDCRHWQPVKARNVEELKTEQENYNGSGAI